MGVYEEYAEVYDRSGQLAFSLKMLSYLEKLLQRHPVQGRTVLELACGTGTVAVALAKAGWKVYAVDLSARMLAQARAKAQEAKAHVIWSQQDMRRFVLPERVHLVTCLYDSLNYMLTSEDLEAVFRRVYAALRPGGLFAFDMNTAWALATLWNGETYFNDFGDLAVVFQSKYSEQEQRTTVRVTCFQQVRGKLYRKIVEEHTEQAYPPEHVSTLLCDVGFAIEGQYDCFSFSPPTETSMRIMWVARRPA